MRRLEDVIKEYDPEDRKGRKKIHIIEWFQRHPGHRFDRAELTREVGRELDVGRKQIGNYLEELTEEDVLTSYGDQRKAYQLSEDIIIPVKYLAWASLQYLFEIFDLKRWGIAGVSTFTTVIWAAITLPFWFLWGSLVLLPSDEIGPLTQSDLLAMAVAMTIWLIILGLISSILYRAHRWHASH